MYLKKLQQKSYSFQLSHAFQKLDQFIYYYIPDQKLPQFIILSPTSYVAMYISGRIIFHVSGSITTEICYKNSTTVLVALNKTTYIIFKTHKIIIYSQRKIVNDSVLTFRGEGIPWDFLHTELNLKHCYYQNVQMSFPKSLF